MNIFNCLSSSAEKVKTKSMYNHRIKTIRNNLDWKAIKTGSNSWTDLHATRPPFPII